MTSQDTKTIIKASHNIDFLDFVESYSNHYRSLERDITQFFFSKNPNTTPRLTLIRMWRFFVAYTLGFGPYDPQTTTALNESCTEKWAVEQLKTRLKQQYEIKIKKL